MTQRNNARERAIELATGSGFCFGVRRAIEMATRTLKRGRDVYSLGPVIHNPQEIARLEGMGLKVIERVEEAGSEGLLVIRSHGASPATIEAAQRRGLELVDATCPLVKRAQNLAKALHEEGYRVLVAGDADHPEVQAILGHAPGAVVVREIEDVAEVLGEPRVGVISQTTQSPAWYRDLTAQIARRFTGNELRIHNTICSATMDRQRAALELAERVDVMFVLGGRNSSNTRKLADICREADVEVHHLESADELRSEMLAGRRSIGVTAGASTPEWLVREFIERLKSLD